MASPRLSLRWQIALWSLGLGLVFAALAFVGTVPLLQQAAIRQRATQLLPLLAALSGLGAVLLALAIYALLVRLVARPADRLIEATERIGAASVADAPLLSEQGPVFGRLGTAFDRMSARLLAEQERVQLQLDQLRAMNRALTETRDAMVRQEKLATVGRLSAGVAHEVGNPLAALLGYLDLLRLKPEARALAEYLERMEREARRIDRIMRDLLDFARPSRGLPPHPLQPGPLVERTLRLVSGQKRFRGVTLESHVEERLPLVRADEHHLQQVLVNLLINAADAMGGQGRIVVASVVDARSVALLIADEGPGIPAADLPHIFDPFFTTKEPGEGTGLGLSISQSLVESFGGTIEVRNRPEGGAEFVVRLPVVEVDHAPPARPS